MLHVRSAVWEKGIEHIISRCFDLTGFSYVSEAFNVPCDYTYTEMHTAYKAGHQTFELHENVYLKVRIM